MERNLAHVEKIKEIRPIEGADSIEVATVLGWECVVKKGEYKPGDMVIYIEIDSKVPEADWSEFLRKNNFKVKTIKLRGQVSQGLIIPLSTLSGKFKEGQDVTAKLGIKKIVQARQRTEVVLKQPKTRFGKWLMRFGWFRALRKKMTKPTQQNFPGWIAKTDVERIQNLRDGVPKIDRPCWVTEKVDGQSCTLYKHGSKYGVCSRNLELLKEDGSWWTVANEILYKDRLDSLEPEKTAVIQGEIIGPGIQKNKYNRNNYEFYVFNVIVDGVQYTYDEMYSWAGKQGLNVVPFVESMNVNKIGDVKDWVEYSKGTSKLNKDIQREGIVVRIGNNYNSFKVINPDFLLKYEPEDEDY